MPKRTKQIFFIFIMTILMSVFFSKFVGNFVYSILRPVGGLGPEIQCTECLDGFILVYLFFISLFLGILKVWKKSLFFLVPLLFFINPPYEFLIIGIALISLGLILSWAILLIKVHFNKN